MSKTVAAEELQHDFPALLKEARESRETILITTGGEVVARVIPIDSEFGPMYGTARIVGDIMEPLDDWECERERLGPEWSPQE